MATTAARLYKMASEQSDNKSESRQSESLASIKMPDSFTRPTNFSDLHRAYGLMKQSNFAKEEKERFKHMCKTKGFIPSQNFDKILEDPEPTFNKIIKGMDNFKISTQKDWIKDKHEPSFPRYKKKTDVLIGTPQNDKLKTFYQYEKNEISKDDLRQKIGDQDFSRLEPMLKNIEDGRYRKATHELMLDQDARHMVNETPVKNSTQIFSKVSLPNYGSIYLNQQTTVDL